MPTPTTRDKLIQAMSRSMQTRGFGATGMKDVLESAGVSSGSMYHAFPRGKEELGAAAVRDVGLSAAQQIRGALETSDSTAQGVKAIFGALMADLERSGFRYGCPIGVPATEAAAVSDEIQAACDEVFNAWVAAYRDALVDEGWPAEPAQDLALAIVTAYEGSVTMARALRSTEPIVNTAHHLVARVEQGPATD